MTMAAQRREPAPLPTLTMSCLHDIERALDSRKSDRPCSINDMRFSERPAPCATCACVMPAFSRASRRFFPKTAAAEGSACRLRVAFLGVDVIANRSCSLGQTTTNTLTIL